jgi:hypothetical protein
MEIGGYPKIYNLGHKAVRDIFKSRTLIQEKVDGSQISFMKKDGIVYARSKGKMLYFEQQEKMFANGLECIWQTAHQLKEGWVYRGEYLQKPKHNVLQYDRVPMNHIILYDIQVRSEEYLSPIELKLHAENLGFESVPFWLMEGSPGKGVLDELLNRTSLLGGATLEGIVIKNYDMWDPMTGKTLMGKWVSEAFKEVHKKKKYKTTRSDVIQSLIENYRTDARWHKAVQHIRDEGKLQDSPTDIGSLIKEVCVDVHEECKDEIQEILFKHFWKQIARGITAGLPEWYKGMLIDKQFETEPEHGKEGLTW